MKASPFTFSLFLALPASAAVTIDYVPVGNAGNAADTTGYGAVAYEYQIGKYEVTNTQYADFLNTKATTDSYSLYNANMSDYGIIQSGASGSYTYSVTSGLEQRPVVYVSWFDAARFSNWLANGQGSGDTETGSYTLNGATSGMIAPNEGATIRLPSEDEWYKAAYYNGTTSTYSDYANGKDTITLAEANIHWNSGGSFDRSTDVGYYDNVSSAYGTYDQTGNVRELFDRDDEFSQGERGGAFNSTYVFAPATFSSNVSPAAEARSTGFRVASVSAVPEPASWLSTAGLLGCAVMFRRRKL